MSITTHQTDSRPRSPTYNCKRDACQGVITPEAAIEGYCSHECHLQDEGQRLLNLVKHDHRFCYTCFRQLKTVHDVPGWRRRRLDPITESVVTGFQSRTEHAQLGERTHSRPGTLPDDTRRGTICECGQTNHQDREGLIQSSNIKTVASNLHATLEYLREEGQHETKIAYLPLVKVLHAQYQHDPGYDFPMAVALAAHNGKDGDQ